MLSVVIAASRRALASFILVLGLWLAGWVAEFRVGHPYGDATRPPPPPYNRCAVGTSGCISVRPEWTIPAAIATAFLSIASAYLLYRGRPNWPGHPRAKPPQAGVFELPPR